MTRVSAVIERFKTVAKRGSIPVLLLLLSACSSVVATRVNTFRAPEDVVPGSTIAVQALRTDLNKSLEFAWYRTQVEKALTDLGFQVVAADSAELLALLDYGVEPVDSDRSGPIFTTGWGVGRSRYFGTNMVIVDDQRRQEFLRHVQLVIEQNREDGQRVYEVSGASQGRCGVLTVVFDEMLTAMLKGFPVENASVKTISVKGDARC